MTFNRNAIPVLAVLAAAGLAITACEEKPAGSGATGGGQGQSLVDQAKQAGDQVKKEAEDALAAAAKARDEFLAKSTEQVRAMETQITEFIGSARERMPDAGAELNRVRDELNSQVARAKVELQKVQNAGAEGWQDVSKSFNAAYAELQRTFSQVKEQFSATLPKLPGS